MAEVPCTRFRLSRAQRLQRPAEFECARQQGGRAVRGCLIMNWLGKPPGSPNRLGVVTSRKVGKAVIRSRSRRLMREAFRHHQHQLRGPVDLVLVARPSIAGKGLQAVERDLLALLRSAGLLARPR